MRGRKVYSLEFRIQSVTVWRFAVMTPRLAIDGAALEELTFFGRFAHEAISEYATLLSRA